jgi:hypothetical protein
MSMLDLRDTPGGLLLYAIAAEIDKRQATVVPGARVCRACGGRGETIVALDQGRFVDPSFINECRRNGWIGRIRESPGAVWAEYGHTGNVPRARIVVTPCVCTGAAVPAMRIGIRVMVSHDGSEGAEVTRLGTRPDTVSLAWLVAYLAEQRTPAFEWPAQWLVDMDLREANGDTSWVAVWWAQFYAWTRGVALDEARLQWALDQARPRPDMRDLVSRWADATGMPRDLLFGEHGGGLGAGSPERDNWHRYEQMVQEEPGTFGDYRDATARISSRGTGRTTRMIEDAAAAVRNGYRVLIIAATQRDAIAYSDRVAEISGRFHLRADWVRHAGMDTAVDALRGSDLLPFVDHRAWETGSPSDCMALREEIDRRGPGDRFRARMVAAPVSYTWDEIAAAQPGHDIAAERMRAEQAAIARDIRAGHMTSAESIAALRMAGLLPDDEPVIP